MKEFFGCILAIASLGVIFCGIAWIAQGNEIFLYRYFAPKMEQARRETFEQSKAYTQGQIQELQNMQFEYVGADQAHKAALASIILHRAADFDQNSLPPDLYQFINDLRNQRTSAQ